MTSPRLCDDACRAFDLPTRRSVLQPFGKRGGGASRCHASRCWGTNRHLHRSETVQESSARGRENKESLCGRFRRTRPIRSHAPQATTASVSVTGHFASSDTSSPPRLNHHCRYLPWSRDLHAYKHIKMSIVPSLQSRTGQALQNEIKKLIKTRLHV